MVGSVTAFEIRVAPTSHSRDGAGHVARADGCRGRMATAPPTTLTTFTELARYGRLYTGGKVAAHGTSFIVCPCGSKINVIGVQSGRTILMVPSCRDGARHSRCGRTVASS